MSNKNPQKSVPGSPNGYNEDVYAVLSDSLRLFEGKILTLIDASIQDVEQRKALKDIFRQMLWSWAINETCRVDYSDVKFRELSGGFYKMEAQTKSVK